MQIFVRCITGKTVVLWVKSPDTLTSVKQRIHERTNVPSQGQLLFWSGKQLEDERTLADYNIQDEATLQQVCRLRGGAMQIYIKSLKGQILNLEVELSDTVDNTKQKVFEQWNLPVENQHLVYAGKSLTEGTLADYNIRMHSVICLAIRVHGGGSSL